MKQIKRLILVAFCCVSIFCTGSVTQAATDYSYTPKTQTAAPTAEPTETPATAAEKYKEIGNHMLNNNKINAIVLLSLCGALAIVLCKNGKITTRRRKR